MIIQHNISAIFAQRTLNQTDGLLQKNLEKLSSGFRINSAADDAAGLAISETMRSKINGMKVATRNTQDAISLIQVAEGAFIEVTSMIQRLRELAVQSSNGTYTSSDRSKIQVEVNQLLSEMNRVGSVTQFNGLQILSGVGGASMTFHVGADYDDTIGISISTMSSAKLGITELDSRISGNIGIQTSEGASSAISMLDNALASINTQRANLGAFQNRLEHTLTNLGISQENMQAAESRIRDLDMATEISDYTKNQIISQAGIAMLAQANLKPQSILKLLQ